VSESRNGMPLEGVRVVEIGSLLAGPCCGQLLVDCGAEVMKVEYNEVQYNDAVCEKALGLGEEERDGLRERGVI
jgi:crotonobetainyl-CoA:carnitine CoA-transferase CaiB-like acyl-CoA transferase